MKKIIDFILKKPIFCLIILTIVLFISPAIIARPQSFDKLIVKNIGVDKLGDEYEVTMLAYIPKPAQTFSENYQIFSAKGITINDAILNISKITGKNVALAESNLIIVNKELCEYGILAALDFLVREYSLGNNSNVFCTDNSKEMIGIGQNIAQDVGVSIQNIAEYNKKHVLPAYNYLEEIYSASLSPNTTTLLSLITLNEEEGIASPSPGENYSSDDGESSSTGNQDSSSQDSSSQDSSNQDSSQESSQGKKIRNMGDAIVLKDGKKLLELNYKEVFNLSWGESFKDFGLVQLSGYNSDIFTNANISFYIFENKTRIKTYFEEDLPVCEINIRPKLVLDEVDQEQLNVDFYRKTYNFGSHEMLEELNVKIGRDFSQALNNMLKNKCDLFDFYEKFYANNTQKFKDFLKDFEDVDDFLKKIEVRINVVTTLVE